MIGPATPPSLQRDRAYAWLWARQLGNADFASLWRMEVLKAILAECESAPGAMPDPASGESIPALRDRLTHAFAFAIGSLLFLGWALRWLLSSQLSNRLPDRASRLVASHGEWSTRTRHVLGAVHRAAPEIDGIVLVGRFRHPPGRIAALWREHLETPVPPLIAPLSFRAVAASLAQWPQLLAVAWNAPSTPQVARAMRTLVPIAFRLAQGSASACWWRQSGCRAREIVFGITGTADISLLERAMQTNGARTVHAVHGQATGPNFLGHSSIALFRSGHDADTYGASRCYGECAVQPAALPPPVSRGERGLLLLTNLAHPMNAGYRRSGPADEIALIRATSAAAAKLGEAAHPLVWKPHPSLDRLPDAATVRDAARDAGFVETPATQPLADLAGRARWVVSSPSTVALDLLEAGVACLVVDPQGTVAGTAIEAMPQSRCDASAIMAALGRLDDDSDHARRYAECFQAIRPARPLDLAAHIGDG